MATILINGKECELPEGRNLNAIQAAARHGVEIPYYCWHPALSVVASCRMCEVEVGTRDPATGEVKMLPRLAPACQTAARPNTVIVTNSPKVIEHQRMIMEMLLLNHPLDCPVCDQAGECGLQDYSMEHGQAVHRFVEERTVNPRKDVSDTIQLNQDRCIMCSRCVRFTREISGTAELQVQRRGHHAEIGVFPGVSEPNPLSGNVVDLCPVGALLDKDFLHTQRVWYLRKRDAICTGCATGCNVTAEENKGRLWRFKPRHNPRVNDHWICDEGRRFYKRAHDEDLLDGCYVLEGGDASREHRRAGPIEAARLAGEALASAARGGAKLVGVLSPFLTVEEAYLAAVYLKGLAGDRATLAMGPTPVEGEDRTFAPDKRKGRTGDTSFVTPRPFTIRAEKAPNRRGVEAVLRHFQGEAIGYDAIAERIAGGEFGAGLFAIGSPRDWIDEASARRIRGGLKTLALMDARLSPLAHLSDFALASATFAEKAGCYANADNRLQYAAAALPPREGTLPDLDTLSILLGREGAGTVPASSRSVLAELAGAVPAFAAAAGGVPEFGLPLDGEDPDDGEEPFKDRWFFGRGERAAAAGS